MKRRSFIGTLGAGSLSGLNLIKGALANEAKANTNETLSRTTGDKEKRFEVLPSQRILLDGDSISKGIAFGHYGDPSPLGTLYGMARILMKDNLAHPPQFLWLEGIWDGINPDGTPKTVDSLASEIQLYVRRGRIRTGDWLIYEDAGGLDNFVHPAPWPDAKNIYQRYRQSLRDMVLEAQGAMDREHIRFMTMFDYNPRIPWAKWDEPLDDGVHTGNDAIRDEATALGVPWIDMNRIMDRAEGYIEKQGWGRIVGPDGIHPNVYGYFVMTLAILDSIGADIGNWKIDGLYPHFRHPEAGGDVKTVWGFTQDPADAERITMLEDLRKLVTEECRAIPDTHLNLRASEHCVPRFYPTAHTFRKMIRYGRLIDHAPKQPEGTSRVASYEIGKMFQLDKDTALMVASLREQGGHDFEIGNDGFIFRELADILPERAIPINRLDSNYVTKAGKKAVLSKYSTTGGFVPLGAKLPDGSTHPAAGTGFLLSAALSFLPDRSEVAPNPDQFVEMYQMAWNGSSLSVKKFELPKPFDTSLVDIGFNALSQNTGFLCPVVSDQGVQVLRFDSVDGNWTPTKASAGFSIDHSDTRIKPANMPGTNIPFATNAGEIEPSMVRVDGSYWVYTRGSDRRGRIYRSGDGLNFYFEFDHYNHTVPQVLNQGLDGGVYLATNTGPGWLRNPLYALALRGRSFVDPVIVHDEKQIGDDHGRTTGGEVPFCDHGTGENIFLNGRWRHFLMYRILDLRETNGEGAPPTPQTGLYLAEFVYDNVTNAPFRF